MRVTFWSEFPATASVMVLGPEFVSIMFGHVPGRASRFQICRRMWISCTQLAELPHASVAVHVRRMIAWNRSAGQPVVIPGASVCVIVTLGEAGQVVVAVATPVSSGSMEDPQKSLAVSGHVSTRPPVVPLDRACAEGMKADVVSARVRAMKGTNEVDKLILQDALGT